MRLLHFSDLHLGVELYGTIDTRTGLSTRVEDFLCALDQIIERAIQEPVDAVLFTGDAFKNRDPSPTLQREFAKRIGRLAAAKVPVVLLVGNHDLPNVASRATAVEIYEVLEVQGVRVFRNLTTASIDTRSGPLQIVAVPWISRSQLLSRDELRELGDASLEKRAQAMISGAVARLTERLDPAIPAILMAHVSVQGATLGYEQSVLLGGDITLGLDDLHARAFDYIALGHIHRHQQVGSVPPAVYAGSPERVDFGEEGEEKGYVLVTLDEAAERTRRATWEFVRLPARPFHTIRIDARGAEPMERVRHDLKRQGRHIAGAIVRCVIRVDSGAERAIAIGEIRRTIAQAGAAYVANIFIESEASSRVRQAIKDEQARDALHMLSLWLETSQLDESMRKRVLERGATLVDKRRQLLERSDGRG